MKTLQSILIPLLLFGGCLVVLLLTAAPSIHTTDSPELAAAAESLGIVHAPGYPLYILIAHLFTWLPVGDTAYQVNLFSAVSIALSASTVYGLVDGLVKDKIVALSTALLFVWSYYIWTIGLVAEVYAPQILALTLCGLLLVYLRHSLSLKVILLVGLAYGLAVALNPSSIFFAPGLVAAFYLLKVPRQWSVASGLLSLLVFMVCLAYFPLSYASDPEINAAGTYNSQGEFETIDLQSPSGIWWLLSGKQFDSFFFSDGILPTPERLGNTAAWLFGNFIGFGVLLGGLGLYSLYLNQRGILLVWLLFFLPYTYFYITYGADDRDMMFAPSYLLWAVVIGVGLKFVVNEFVGNLRYALVMALPLMFLVVNFPLADVSGETDYHDDAQARLDVLPPNAYVFGYWSDMVSLQYFQITEDQREDLKLYNLFFFDYDESVYQPFLDSLLAEDQTVIVLGEAGQDLLDPTRYGLVAFQPEQSIEAFRVESR